jgi:hypothetical protein
MANEIYHRSNWGESKPEGWGDIYFDPSATNKLYNHSDYYENSNGTDKILRDIPNKASITLTPTGYSEDKIGSAIPVDGNGDFTFARNSSATRVNQAGLIEDVNSGTNLVSNPDFSDGSNNWSLGTGWTVSNNTAIHTGSTGNISTNASLTQGKRYVVEFEILSIADGVCNIYDTGSATTYSSFSSVGVKTATITKDSSSSLAIRSNSSNAVIDNVSVIQLDEATDIPRLDYTTGQGAFLLEPQSTNLITYSEDYSQSEWTNSSYTKDATITNNSQSVAPDGTLGVYQYECTVSGSNSQLGALKSITSGVAYTSSFYIKRISGNGNVKIRDVNNTELDITDNLTSDWKRYTITGTSNSTNGRVYVNVLNAGDIIEVWGVQLEQQSYATSYIPTVGSTVTRSAESANSSGNSDLINSTEGVLYAQIASLTTEGTGSTRLSLNDGSQDNNITIGYSASNTVRIIIRSSSSNQALITSTQTITDFLKIAVKYKVNDFSLYINGSLIGTDTSGLAPSGINDFSFDRGDGSLDFYGKVKGLAVFKEALTDIELEKLTSWRDFRDLAESQEYTLVTIKSDAIVVSAYGTTSGGGGVSGGGSGGGGGY